MIYHRIFRTLILAFILLAAECSQAAAQELLQWSSVEGKVVNGEFLRMEGKKVVLKLESGKEVQVPLSSLSLESHLQALKLAKPEAFNKELVKAPVIVEAAEPTSVAPITSIMDSPYGTDPTIDQFLKISVDEWKRGNNFIVWHMLPSRMQQDIEKVIEDTMKTLGSEGSKNLQSTFQVMGSLASKKKDWIIGTDLEVLLGKLFPIVENTEQKDKNWPIMVGMLQKLGSDELWSETNFQRENIVQWLAKLSELIAYSREMEPAMNEIGYNVLSQSADRAEVEATLGTQKKTVNFQKVGNIWLVPESMNALRDRVDQELSSAPTVEKMKPSMAVLPLLGLMLKKLDESKTQEEFNQLLAQSGIGGRLDAIPSQTGKGIEAGLPFDIPGIPLGLLSDSNSSVSTSGGSSGSPSGPSDEDR